MTDQNKNVNIQELIATSSLGTINSIRYDDLQEIIFDDTDSTIEFKFKNDNVPEEKYQIQRSVYSEIKDFLKNNLRGTEVQDYSILKQILPHLIILGISVVLIVATYISAVELQKGESIRISGRRAFLKGIIVSSAEVLGLIGTIVIGILIISSLIYFIIKKYQNPKKGEIIKIKRAPQLTL
ncbi:hypothetical protein LZ575_19725 [Antarcticibacterium sp. 1MA-6-2]|uniref:hypothetical protein n=1 Tax=Antarcticibacterium sp. 1MA-6-2 TaxID=2908210 RepID=UPI001F238C4E|nr:hypothetical protein [Antarcticibacterium sp. 1MA-6-2]UJH90903.1 hypothetical protein LZ575_19725 [Antarcticibacterium sp. 1MA-6-2]